MDGKAIALIAANMTSPFDRKHRILFTSRATKLLGMTFTGASCTEIDFACFCLRLANWCEYFYSHTDRSHKKIQYITLVDIYNYFPLDAISKICQNQFLTALDNFKLEQDSQYGEVSTLLKSMEKDNVVEKTSNCHPVISQFKIEL